jgi:hypothetical protein
MPLSDLKPLPFEDDFRSGAVKLSLEPRSSGSTLSVPAGEEMFELAADANRYYGDGGNGVCLL